MEYLQVLDPTARAEGVDLPAPSGDGFQAKHVALLSNEWPSWDTMVNLLSTGLKSRFEAQPARWSVPIASGASEEVLDEVAAKCDVALVGLAN